MQNRRITVVTIVTVVAVCALIGVTVSARRPGDHAQARSLAILLTNDDGFDSTGLKVMHAALVAAGHRVTVVAPAANMSSTSMSMTSGVWKVDRKSESIWAVSKVVIYTQIRLLGNAKSDRLRSCFSCASLRVRSVRRATPELLFDLCEFLGLGAAQRNKILGPHGADYLATTQATRVEVPTFTESAGI